MKIRDIDVFDVRFPTSKTLAGSDAVHKSPDYSCVYVVLKTDDETCPEGYGLTFTLGRGNEIVAACVKALKRHVVDKDFDKDILQDMMNAEDHAGFYYRLCQDGQLRWLGPEKGVVAMAAGAIMNAVWDLMARRAKEPLWLFVSKMEPETLIRFIDFKHIQDFVSKKEALGILKGVRKGWKDRVARMKEKGFRAYTTSCGWLGYENDVIRAKCREALAKGHRYFKMKVGSKNPERDVERAAVIREIIGDENYLMMDANQKWGVGEAIEKMQRLQDFDPMWIEEPTSCDDVVGHQKIAQNLTRGRCGVATGEACANKVLFKQLLQLDAIRYCQIDSCRVAGVGEILAILLMCAKKGVKVCPHAGGVGLCEYVRHLAMIDYVVFNPNDAPDRICESVDDAEGYFYDPVRHIRTDDGLFYRAPELCGYARMKPEVVRKHLFPFGPVWRSDPKGQAAAREMTEDARKTLANGGGAGSCRSGSLVVVVLCSLAAAVALSSMPRGWVRK